jgi:tetratricopeptide (TPR) repeat protein
MPASPENLFKRAVAAYQAERLERAGAICRALLKRAPGHGAALHLLGVIELKLGHPEEAERFIGKLSAMAPDSARAHYSFAHVLAVRGKFSEAIIEYRRALALEPGHGPTHLALGNALKALGQGTEAARAYADALRIKADYPEALNGLGAVLCEQKKYGEAVDYFERALALRPEFPDALNNLGGVSIELGRFSEAERYCERAIALQPDSPAALNNLGNALRARGNWTEAISCYERALAIRPDSPEIRNNLGLAILNSRSDLDAAAAHFRKVLVQYPDHVPAMTHLAITLYHQGEFAEAAACCERALALRPDYLYALNNLGNALKALGRLPEAIAAYKRFVAVEPDDPEAHNNLAMALLLDGRFDEGWREFEWRLKTAQLASGPRDFPQPQWRGEEAGGRSLLIHAEQGFGDTIQFCRYAPLAAARGWRVILEVQPQLVRLMESLPGVEKVIARGEPPPDFDFHCPMLSLPLAFATRPETIPASHSYLAVEEKALAAWQKRLQADPERFRIGLVWAGNPRPFSFELSATDRRRSMPPEALAPLAPLPGTRFYSLQKEGPEPPVELGIIDWMAECHDFSDTAALIANLDLVISVDTAVVHLAAALGRPIWLLNRRDSCWRWFLERDESPWYPTLRLFRQPRPGDWESVVERVKKQLERILRNGRVLS